MNTRVVFALIVLAMLAACERPARDYPAEGAALLAPFKAELKSELQKGMQAGPVEAIDACRVAAPGISTPTRRTWVWTTTAGSCSVVMPS